MGSDIADSWRRNPQLANLPNVIGRDEAKALGLKSFFTSEPCKRGHIAARDVSSSECTECKRRRLNEWRAANLEKAKERERERCRKYRAADPERARENGRRQRAARKDKQIIRGAGLTKRRAAQLRKEAVAQRRAARAAAELNRGAGQTGASEGNLEA
jgi:hypothetical protein